jgi:hypothetical protein
MILSVNKSTSTIICSASILLCLALVSCKEKKSEVSISYPDGWFKGNTHSHTRISDGNASPEYVVNWYHEHGYNFLVLTDHNKFVNPDRGYREEGNPYYRAECSWLYPPRV